MCRNFDNFLYLCEIIQHSDWFFWGRMLVVFDLVYKWNDFWLNKTIALIFTIHQHEVKFLFLIMSLYLSSAFDIHCKLFEPRSRPTFWSGSKPFDTMIVFLKDYFFMKKKGNLKKSQFSMWGLS